MTSNQQLLIYLLLMAICLLLMAYFTRRYLTKLKWFADQKPTKDRDEKVKWHYYRFSFIILFLTIVGPLWSFFDLDIWRTFEGINPLLGVLISIWPFFIHVFYFYKFKSREMVEIHSRLHNTNH